MKIKKVNILNFQGFNGSQEFHFGKITALCGKNGIGKTSLLNAIRYGVTGLEPIGEIINKNSEKTAIKIELENEKSFTRMKYAQKGKQAKYYSGKSPTPLKQINECISREMNATSTETAKLISSSELLSRLSNQQFGELLLTYLPEQMSRQMILDSYSDASKEEKDIINKCIPDGYFGVEQLSQFYELLTERRRLLKQAIKEKEAIVRNYGEVPTPTETVSSIEKRQKLLQTSRDQIIKKTVQLESYNETQQRLLNHKAERERILSEVSKIGNKGKEYAKEEKELIESNLKKARESSNNAYVALQQLKTASLTIEKSINTISQSFCPLSEKIKCTTDKTIVLNDLKKSVESTKTAYDKQKEVYNATLKAIEGLEKKQKTIIEDESKFLKAKNFKCQLENLEKIISAVKLPAKPIIEENIESVDIKIKQCKDAISIFEKIAARDKIIRKLEDNKEKLFHYENLITAFSPKGKVKEDVITFYLEEFSRPCNEKAKKFSSYMHLKFESNAGVEVLTDIQGNGNYLGFNSLSKGEQMRVSFLLMSMLSNLSGFRMILLDELDSLDNDNFEKLIDSIKENQDEFDTCILACVKHQDTLAILKNKGINILELDTKQV